MHAYWSCVRGLHVCLHQHHFPDDGGAECGHPAPAAQRRSGDTAARAPAHPTVVGGQLPPGRGPTGAQSQLHVGVQRV